MGDLSGKLAQGLNTPLKEAKGFYGVFAGLLVVAGIVTLIPSAPLGLITLAVQAMCGLMLPSTTIFVLLLANDKETLGPWVNSRALNALAVIIVAILAVLSVVMMVSTLFPSAPVLPLLEWLGAIALMGLLVGLPIGLRRMGPRPEFGVDKLDWRMPRQALLAPAPRTRARKILLGVTGTYLAVAGTLLVVRIVQLATS